MDIEDYPDKIFINCVGVDEKHHICEPHKKECFCGMKIKTKKFKDKDFHRLGCYPCTY